MTITERFAAAWSALFATGTGAGREQGGRTTENERLELLYQSLTPNLGLRAKIREIREMDERDPRVKKIHERTARTACKGGLTLRIKPSEKRVISIWADFERRCELYRREKLESDMRGAVMEGNLPLQWVIDFDLNAVLRGIRMPTETLRPVVSENGQFTSPTTAAYEQWDWLSGKVIGTFPLWKLQMVRIRPDNYDNWGSFGRPYLDATRTIWRQLHMTERDMVVRRHMRAPQRLAHVLEGANETELQTYENKVLAKQGKITTDFFLNRKGAVTAIEGDAHLDEIADVVHLLDTFFSGAPAPKGLFGYAGDLSRDILEDLKRDYYDEVDALQDTVSYAYELGFRMELLMRGINPDGVDFDVNFAERRTDTPNQRADLALKYQALNVPPTMVYESAGLNPARVRELQDEERDRMDPYPNPTKTRGLPTVKITPSNARKNESATVIGNS